MLTTIIAFIVVLGILIFFHELGHFVMAKWIGIRVERFSLGFGPKIIGHTYGDTEYRISALPFGGYVKMTGENPEEPLKGEPWEFGSRSIWERTRVVICGPLMNLILAVVFLGLPFFLGGSGGEPAGRERTHVGGSGGRFSALPCISREFPYTVSRQYSLFTLPWTCRCESRRH